MPKKEHFTYESESELQVELLGRKAMKFSDLFIDS